MAQRKETGRRWCSFARRYGITARRGTIVCLVVFMLVAAVVGVVVMRGTHGYTMLRTSGVALREGEAPADGEDAGSGVEDSGAAGDNIVEGVGQAGNATLPTFVIHVDGAVAHPGVYRLRGSDLRFDDAVKQAGGLLPDADTSAINLAAPLVDGAKLHVPLVGESGISASGQAASAGGAGSSGLVNLNTASAEELQTLSGVGEVTAQAIIEEREAHGPYVSIEDVMRVSGIGEKKFARIKDSICV